MESAQSPSRKPRESQARAVGISSASSTADSLQAILDKTVPISRSPSVSAPSRSVADQLMQLLQADDFRALPAQEQADITIEVQEIAVELERAVPKGETVRRRLRGLARMLRGIGIGAPGSEIGNLVSGWLTT
jgi:hypothetical protein